MKVEDQSEGPAASQETALQGLSRDDLLRLVTQIQQSPQGAGNVAVAS